MADWAQQDKAQSHALGTWARRLKLLRPFARWLVQFEPRTEVPDVLVFGSVPGRVAPHIYREAEIVELLAAARGLNPQGGLRPPESTKLIDITPELILAFLNHLEQVRHNTVRSRNARLAALRAFLKFAAHRDVSSLHTIERALGVPMKRFERPMLGFLSREEMLAVIGKPDSTWISQRDHLLLGMLYNTGARVSEIIDVRVADVVLDVSACVHLHGKGRKQRSVPLWRSTVKEIRAWLKLNPHMGVSSALLPNRDGETMTKNNVTKLLALAVQTAAKDNPALSNHPISPHTIRHTTAMHLLQAGVDISVIAIWLGHDSPSTTHHYVEADLAMKDRALTRLQEPDANIRRYHATDSLLEVLKDPVIMYTRA